MRMRPSTAPLLVRRTANLTSALVVTVGRVTEIVQLFPDPLSALALTAISGPVSARAQMRTSSRRLGDAAVPLNDRNAGRAAGLQLAPSYLPNERPRFAGNWA